MRQRDEDRDLLELDKISLDRGYKYIFILELLLTPK